MYALTSYSVNPKSFKALLVVSDTVIYMHLGMRWVDGEAGFWDESVNSDESILVMFRRQATALVDKNLVMDQLRSVLDPEIGRSIVDLKMVREVTVNNGSVSVKIALTVAHCPLSKTLQADVESAVRKLVDVTSVKVETTTMTRKELE